MSKQLPDILVLEQKVQPEELRRLVERFFGDMVKYVVDIRLRIAAVGGELHADTVQILLQRGSRQKDLWGANYYPGLGHDQLTDLTIQANAKPTLRREILRWRDLIAKLYISAEPDVEAHTFAFKSLLLFTPEASKQRRHLMPRFLAGWPKVGFP